MFHRPSPSVRSTRMETGILPPTIDTTSSDDGSCSDGSGSHSTINTNSSRSKSNTSSPDSSPRHNTNVNRPHQNNTPNGIFRPYHLYRIVAPLLWLLMGGAIVIIVFLGFGKRFEPSSSSSSSRFVFWNQPAVTHVRPRSDLRHPLDISTTPNTINSLRNVHGGSSTSSSIPDNVLGDPSNPPHLQCRWYLAESAIPHSGLGIFTGIGLHKDDMIGFPDICIFVHDPPDHWTHLRSHSFGRGSFFGQYEGIQSRAACEGLITTVNTVPDGMVNMEMVSPMIPTHAGLHRATSPGAGASTHHYGIHGKALDIITAGSEITINYGDWDFDSEDEKLYQQKPSRNVQWLQQHGWCIDQIEIARSTIPHAGRGAFARMPLSRGTVVAPAPLQVFKDRKIFQSTSPEQLYVNYCLQPKDSTMLLFPYGQGVNLINHSYRQPNVEWRWSTKTNHMHHSQWFDLSHDEFWNMVSPGSLILEVVALRDIGEGEELFINYGSSWDEAWQKHMAHWQPPINASEYVYPMEVDETEMLRTILEQKSNPYPANLMTMCLTSDFERSDGNHIEWTEPEDYAWSEGMTYCHILDRKYDRTIADYTYTVSLIFSFDPADFVYDPKIPKKDLYLDYNVPRRAVRFIEIPYMDDEHLPNAFRHPLELPPHLVPESWKNVLVNHDAVTPTI